MIKALFALAVPHCPWDPARVRSWKRLEAQLDGPNGPRSFQLFGEVGPTPNHVWADKVLRWGESECEEHHCTHLVQIQDDAILVPDFWKTLHAVALAVPNEVIGLYTIHSAAPHLLRTGQPWLTTTDLLTGVGWIMPRATLLAYNHWREEALRPGAEKHVNEDTLIGLFCAATNRRIWSPLPTLVDHDDDLPSHYGNEEHKFRRSSCSWELLTSQRDLTWPGWWDTKGAAPPHFGRAYQYTHHWFARWVKDYPGWEGDYERIAADEVTWKVEATRRPPAEA